LLASIWLGLLTAGAYDGRRRFVTDVLAARGGGCAEMASSANVVLTVCPRAFSTHTTAM
jgi:hypothetical protein